MLVKGRMGEGDRVAGSGSSASSFADVRFPTRAATPTCTPTAGCRRNGRPRRRRRPWRARPGACGRPCLAGPRNSDCWSRRSARPARACRDSWPGTCCSRPRATPARLPENPVEPFGLGLPLDQAAAGHDHRRPRRAATRWPRTTAAAARRSSIRPLVHEPMNTRSIGIVGDRRARLEAHVLQGRGGGLRSAGSAKSAGSGTLPPTSLPGRGWCPR